MEVGFSPGVNYNSLALLHFPTSMTIVDCEGWDTFSASGRSPRWHECSPIRPVTLRRWVNGNDWTFERLSWWRAWIHQQFEYTTQIRYQWSIQRWLLPLSPAQWRTRLPLILQFASQLPIHGLPHHYLPFRHLPSPFVSYSSSLSLCQRDWKYHLLVHHMRDISVS